MDNNMLSAKETDLLVSILNTIYERLTAEECGPFGYNKDDLKISCDDCSLQEGLQELWDEICRWDLAYRKDYF